MPGLPGPCQQVAGGLATRRKATFSWWQSHTFSASSRRRDLNKLTITIAVVCKAANIGRQSATILPCHANPPGWDFRKGQVTGD
jgi:hypothetical protein